MTDIRAEGTDTRAYMTCPLCEATCGLEVSLQDQEITAIRGDLEDVFSRGYLCPKGHALKELHTDPDRLRAPLVRVGERWRAVSWQEAFATAAAGLQAVIAKSGRDAVGVYLGNPNVHNLAGQLYAPVFLRALGSRNRFSASTVDQMPKQVAAAMMFGTGFSIPIPDIDRDRLIG